MRVIEYLQVLQPRRVIWFLAFAIGGISLSGAISYAIGREIGTNGKATGAIGILVALLIVLFISGLNAWDKERIKNADKWPRLNTAQRIAIADALKPFSDKRKYRFSPRWTIQPISLWIYAIF
jgi:hypothetical protein